MKFRFVGVLDDPEAESLAKVGATALLQACVPDDDVIYASLAALRESDSLRSFYSKQIRDSKGNVRSLSECVTRANELLRAEEDRFLGFVRQIIDSVKTGASTLATPWDVHRATVSLTNGWHIARFGQPLNESTAVLGVLYVYFAFVVFCARDRISRSHAEDLNDYEDARFCQHVRLDTPCIIVSRDNRQRRRLNEVFELLDAVAVIGLHHAHRAIAVEDLP